MSIIFWLRWYPFHIYLSNPKTLSLALLVVPSCQDHDMRCGPPNPEWKHNHNEHKGLCWKLIKLSSLKNYPYGPAVCITLNLQTLNFICQIVAHSPSLQSYTWNSSIIHGLNKLNSIEANTKFCVTPFLTLLWGLSIYSYSSCHLR